MSLTEAQQRAVHAEEAQVFVAAGAGSGKTSVLVDRYVHLLIDQSIPPDRLAAVTFTKKSAGELRQRIRNSLLERGHEDLTKAIDQAPIGTIHNLCARILRNEGLFHGIPLEFRILDENESQILAMDAMDQAWEEVLTAAEPDELELLARHADMLTKQVWEAFVALRNRGQQTTELKLPPARSVAAARQALEDALHQVVALSPQSLPNPTAVANWEKANACLDWLSAAGREPADICEAASFVPRMLGAKVRAIFEDERQKLLEWCQALGEAHLLRLATLVSRLLDRFSAVYQQMKEDQEALDFSDLEIKALSILESGDRRLGPPRDLLGVLVDEFQDTNMLQCRLFDSLAPLSLMSVGDYHQSIYGFRGADCEVFEERKSRVSEGCTVPDASGSRGRPDGSACFVPLTVNFRTRDSVLAVINRLFVSEAFFGPSFTPLSPCQERRVDYPCGATQPAVELLSLTEPGQQEGEASFHGESQAAEPDPEREATDEEEAQYQEGGLGFEPALVAARIKALVEEEGWAPGQIALLLRKTVRADAYEKALRAFGIDGYVVGGRGYFARHEVSDVMSLLALIVDPHNDLAFATVLRSPMVNLSDDALWLLGRFRKSHGYPSLFAAVLERDTDLLDDADNLAVRRLLAALDSLRTADSPGGLPGLIDTATRSLDYDLSLLAGPNGRHRWANIRKLMALADAFEEVKGQDLAGFIDYIERRGGVSDKEAQAPVLAENEDVVRIMSVHQAKGLEFPVVVFAGLGERSREDAPGLLLADDSSVCMRMALPGRFAALDNRITLGPYEQVLEDRRQRAREEEARICYVGATRARERLILVGTKKATTTQADKRPLAWFMNAIDLPLHAQVPSGFQPWPGLDLICNPRIVELLEMVAGRQGLSEQKEVEPARNETNVSAPAFPQVDSPPSISSLSFSAINLYRSCPQRFYLERVLGLSPYPPAEGGPVGEGLNDRTTITSETTGDTLDSEEESSGREVGIVVHRMFELACLAPDLPDEAATNQLLAQAQKGVGIDLRAEARTRAQFLFRAYWSAPFSKWSAPSPNLAPDTQLSLLEDESLGCSPGVSGPEEAADGGDTAGGPADGREVPFVFALDGMLVRGVMDRVLVDDGRWTIVDYKTNRLDGRSLSAVSAPYELQARIYGLVGLLSGAENAEVNLLFLDAPEEPLVFTFSLDDKQLLEEQLRNDIRGIAAGEFPRTNGRCHLCPHEMWCGE